MLTPFTVTPIDERTAFVGAPATKAAHVLPSAVNV